ncbi:hypothetical protein GHT06_012111 [Daphnia sinensis]|uniref:Plasmid pRiA4b Orf3-like domain-containing protein n=1 Tax=Daphnia sinensis TaxID=1820382 RepID=A0AAD5LFR4_9CRUS|nr:hypothetical protein GHT06_012111 [Daphnia sinensis]
MAARTSNVYQFKITLERTHPAIWRRIQVPENYNFKQLHLAIQQAMGWQSCQYDYHLHQFEMRNPQTSREVSIGIPDDQGFGGLIGKILDEKRVKISNYFSLSNNTARYDYDFGDGWDHTILLESILPAVAGTRYPQCIAGERACPPEDCGGPHGYKCLMEIMANPSHREYRERKEWLSMIGIEELKPADFDHRSVLFSAM